LNQRQIPGVKEQVIAKDSCAIHRDFIAISLIAATFRNNSLPIE